MTWVNLGLGSNIDAERNMRSCLDALLLRFNDLAVSNVFESEAVGFKGDNFLNMAVGFDTELGIEELAGELKAIEAKHGRDRMQPRFSGRTLDIDILTYGDRTGSVGGIELPRAEITENAFVLWPLSQIAPRQKHPRLQRSFKALWEDYDKSRQKLWPVDFEWHGRVISRRR